MNNINLVTLSILIIFLGPLIYGFLSPITKNRLSSSIASFVDSIEFVLALVFSIFLVSKTFLAGTSNNGSELLRKLYFVLPLSFRTFAETQQLLAFLISLPIAFVIIIGLLRVISNPIYRVMVDYLPNTLCKNSNSLQSRLIGLLCKLPKAIILLLVLIFGLNLYNSLSYNPMLQSQLKDSTAYQQLESSIVNPIMKGKWVDKLPIILNDSFAYEEEGRIDGSQNTVQKIKDLANSKIKIIEYFNGVTLDDAIKSNKEIDSLAISLTKNKKTSKEKSYEIYKWVVQNIEYDDLKAARLSKKEKGISSGAIPAFETRTGVCFDYSSLYIAMCRATGIKVRLVTGLGYSGKAWGDHAWNQVYSVEEDRWINVDTTFGKSINYFDKKGFSQDHKYDEIQGEW